MNEALARLKSEFTKRYLGTHGIHGVGIREVDNAICLYVGRDSNLESSPAFESIVRTAAPFTVVLVHEDAPKTA
ncbi:MAG TPA: hypothetical protein VFC86_13255 [Planctomycetota bacterium]|nr:hypothetical protein [Planctomycetota bacterium]